MTADRKPTSLLERAGVRPEKLLAPSPRGFELVGAVLLGVLALMFLYDFAQHRWFYFQFHQFYRTTPASRIYDWTRALCEILIGAWLTGLAITVGRGGSRRDGGLFSPVALRVWGMVFALASFGLIAASEDVLLSLHLLLSCWSAAIACFVLAARRSKSAQAENPARPNH